MSLARDRYTVTIPAGWLGSTHKKYARTNEFFRHLNKYGL